MKIYLTLILVVVIFPLFAQKTISLSVDTPPSAVALFGRDIISTFINERDFALSRNGTEIYFTISSPKSTFQTIVFSKKNKEGVWTQPEIVPFAGAFSDLEPAFSADGNTLYFSSNRPITGDAPKDFDIWRVSRTGDNWGKPENLGSPVNTDVDEFYPSIAKNGNLYYTAFYKEGIGKEDIYLSAFSSNGYQKPMALDIAINSALYEFNAFVSPDEQYILFTSYGRKDDMGSGDLYMSIKDADGKWKPATNMKELNSRQLDYCPFVSLDGKSLFFTSERHHLPVSFPNSKTTYKDVASIFTDVLNGTGNIYWIDFQKVLKSVR